MARTLDFDPETARAIIMRAFWTRGYEATSLRYLEDATTLVRTSLYNAFGNKPEMFLDSLTLYHATVEARIKALTQGRGSEALAEVIGAMMDGTGRNPMNPAGCLMVMTATQSMTIEPRHLQRVREYRQMLVDKAREVLERDRQSGRLAPGVDPDAAAEFLVCVLWGALAAHCLNAEGNPAAAGAAVLRETVAQWLSD